MIRPAHVRMARAALNWTLRELEEKTGVNKNTISRFEAGREVLSGAIEALEMAFASEGVEFLAEGDLVGVKVKLRSGRAQKAVSRRRARSKSQR